MKDDKIKYFLLGAIFASALFAIIDICHALL